MWDANIGMWGAKYESGTWNVIGRTRNVTSVTTVVYQHIYRYIWWCIWQNFTNSQKGYIWWCHHPKYSINAKYTTIVIWKYDVFVFYTFVSHFWCLLTLIVAEEIIRRFVCCRMLIFSNANPVVPFKKLTTDGYICWCQKQNFLKNRWWIYMLGDIYGGALL